MADQATHTETISEALEQMLRALASESTGDKR